MDTEKLPDERQFYEWQKRAMRCCFLAPSFSLTESEASGLNFESNDLLQWIQLYSNASNRPTLGFCFGDEWVLGALRPEISAELLVPHLISLNFYWWNEPVDEEGEFHTGLEKIELKRNFLYQQVSSFERFCLSKYSEHVCTHLSVEAIAICRQFLKLLIPAISFIQPDFPQPALAKLLSMLQR